ncbi:MAG TPA: prolipoprotein diacylglyceryl transferase [Planctomycetota bacterium]|jgi:phosphatidylglycerol:prolipoprotein diacylglycerol transferase
MHPHLLELPIWVLTLILGGGLGATLVSSQGRLPFAILAGIAGAVLATLFAYLQPWGFDALHGWHTIPIQSYGTMILIGFLFGVWMAARRAPLVGIEARHCVDIGVYGVLVGLTGARLLHIISNWSQFTPFLDYGFEWARVAKMFKIWEAGLDFFGTFLTVIPGAFLYCKYFKLPAVAFLDLAAPGLIAGQAFGRIGCFMYGCCFGKTADVPWAVHFPHQAPAFGQQVSAGLIENTAECSLGVHPTQLYAFLSAALTSGFLYAYWPRRRFDGMIISLLLIMAGATRFFEELMRADEPPVFAALPWFTAAHYFAAGVFVAGIVLLLYFRRRNQLAVGSGQ